MHLAELRDKVIAVDTSIYLYKFMADNTLIEHFYLMISLFRHYNIVPIFVFDGKPPKEKRALLWKRRKQKKESEEKYNELIEKYNGLNDYSSEKNQLKKEMDLLKREIISISNNDLLTVKSLIHAYGAKYMQAEGEADVLCVQLVKQHKAWGCMSDDMDMFVYGCSRVFRHFSLANHSVIYYDFENILETLKINGEVFREIAILSGTDYNCHHKTSLDEMNELYERYRQHGKLSLDGRLHCSKYDDIDGETFGTIMKLFDIHNYNENQGMLENLDQQSCFGEIHMDDLMSILEKDGFIFVQ